MKRLKAENGAAMTVYGFFQSGCMVSIETEVPQSRMPLPPGKYLLNTIKTKGEVKVTRQDGKTFPEIPTYSLAAMVAAGLQRAD